MLAAYPPVIFAPGYGGSDLYGFIRYEVPKACESLVEVNTSFVVVPNAFLEGNMDCLAALLTEPVNTTNIVISTKDFGTFHGISMSYASIPTSFVKYGYTLDQDLFGAPYDYRHMTVESLMNNGFIENMKKLVENAYTLNNNSKVILIGHSNGPPTLYSFLKAMTQEWKDQYIQALISLSGNYLGQMNGYYSLVNNNDASRQNMEATWDATYLTCPYGGSKDSDTSQLPPVVTTYFNSVNEKNYTVNINDMVSLFDSVDKHEWSEKLSEYYNEMDRSESPHVDTYCLYGSNISTSYSFVFTENILQAAPVQIRNMEGDGNQDITDNKFCINWEESLQKEEYVFEAIAFPGVEHMQMVSSDEVNSAIFAIIESYL